MGLPNVEVGSWVMYGVQKRFRLFEERLVKRVSFCDVGAALHESRSRSRSPCGQRRSAAWHGTIGVVNRVCVLHPSISYSTVRFSIQVSLPSQQVQFVLPSLSGLTVATRTR